MDLGALHEMPSDSTKLKIENMFSGTGYNLNWQSDMESYLICHPAAILPMGYLSYICDGNLRKSTRSQRKMMFDASHEAYEFLKAKGITIYPKDDDKFYSFGFRGILMKLLYFFMAKTEIGDLVACEHCRNAVTEIEEIDRFYENLLSESPEVPMENWRKLRSHISSWDELHKKYGN